MIRRKFLKHAPKEHSDEKVKKTLEKHNVPTFEGVQPAKFGQFGNVAKDLNSKNRKTYATPEGGHVAPADKAFSWQQKAIYGGGTGSYHGQGNSSNPYAVSQPQGNPYAAATPSGGVNSSNPYASVGQAPNSRTSSPHSAQPQGDYPQSQGGYPSQSRNAHAHGSQPQNAYSSSPQRLPQNTPGQNAYGSQPHGAPNAYARSANPYGSPYGANDLGSASSTSLNLTRSEFDQPRSQSQPPQGAFRSQPSVRYQSEAPPAPGAPSVYGTRAPGMPAPGVDASGGGRSSDFGEPLARTRTNQSTATTSAARQELFGQAPRRINPHASEFDELNQSHQELEDDDDLLNTAQNLDRPQFMAPSSVAPSAILEEQLEPEDELNQLPSQFQRPADMPSSAPGAGGYGQVGGQQLFEDSEDEDVDYVKREIRQTKQESVESTRRALQIAAEAETSGRNAMGMLGDQGERLGNSAKTVALGNVQARVGERNAEELQRLNRSIFIPNVSNPFNSRRRNQLKEQRLKGEREYDELERESLEAQQRESEQRVADGLNSAGYGYSETALRVRQRMNRDNPERKMYQFEADSDDDALEDELEQNLGGISDAAKRLHGLSLKINGEVTDQNSRIEQMGGRVDDLDHRLHKSTAKMATLH